MKVTPQSGLVVAEIKPPSVGEPPTFRMLSAWERAERDAATKACAHTAFVLDEKRRTVECGSCGARVDAFEALLSYAEWYKHLERKLADIRWEEVRVLQRQARDWSRKRGVSEADRAELLAFAHRSYPSDLTPLLEHGNALLTRVSQGER